MKIKKKYIIILFLFFILNFKGNVLCQDTLQTIEITFTGLGGTYLPAFARGYLNEYESILGGKKNDYLHNFSGSLLLGVQWNEHFRITMKLAYIYAHLNDRFYKETFEGSGIWRGYIENFKVISVPLLVNYDWYYFFDMYKSYLSAGIGMTYSEIDWMEYVDTPIQYDIRKGGKLMKEYTIYPALNLATGIQLDFDEKTIPRIIKGITFGADFIYIFRSTEIFKELEKQIQPYPKELQGNKMVLPFMIGLNIGLVLNLENKQINRIFGNK